MTLSNVLQDLLTQFQNLTHQLSDEDFKKPLPVLFESSIGQHMRHSVEFVSCFLEGVDSGLVCYDKRNHDVTLESDKDLMFAFISELIQKTDNLPDQNIKFILESEYKLSNVKVNVPTNVQRELISNIEHVVHHMALIKVAINTEYNHVSLPTSFGVAQSTIAYREQEV